MAAWSFDSAFSGFIYFFYCEYSLNDQVFSLVLFLSLALLKTKALAIAVMLKELPSEVICYLLII